MNGLPLLLTLLLLATGATRRAPFRPPRVVDLGEGHTPLALAAGDFDGDGKLDLVVGSAGADDVILFSGDGRGGTARADSARRPARGHGRFRLGGKIATGRGSGDVATGDVDGNGLSDAVTANAGSGDVTVAFGGPEGLSPARTVTVPAGGRAQRVLLADFDGDDGADGITANTESHSISILATR